MIVTFTTVPPRFAHLGATLGALAAQTHRPDAVELYLPRRYRRFPGERPALPPLPDWVRVIDVDEDFGPATKILPAAARWRGQAVDLICWDDDRTADPGWLARFAAMRRERPDDVVCEYARELEHVTRDETFRRTDPPGPRAELMRPTPAERRAGTVELRPDGGPALCFRRAGYMDVFYGFRGAMLRPDWLHPRAWSIPEVMWTVDDVWLSGMLELAGRRIWVGTGARWLDGATAVEQIAPLKTHVADGMDRFAANRRCAAHLRETWGIWR